MKKKISFLFIILFIFTMNVYAEIYEYNVKNINEFKIDIVDENNNPVKDVSICFLDEYYKYDICYDLTLQDNGLYKEKEERTPTIEYYYYPLEDYSYENIDGRMYINNIFSSNIIYKDHYDQERIITTDDNGITTNHIIETHKLEKPIVLNNKITNEKYNKDSVYIKSIEYIESKGNVLLKNKPTIENLDMNFDIRFGAVGDYVKYKITLKNDTKENYKILEDTSFNKSNYITYNYEIIDNKLDSNKEIDMYLTITYSKEAIDATFIDNIYEESNLASIKIEDSKGNIINPNTKTTILSSIVILSIVSLICLIYLRKKQKKLLLLFLLLIPIGVYALSEIKIKINTKIEIDKGKYVYTSNRDRYTHGQKIRDYNGIYDYLSRDNLEEGGYAPFLRMYVINDIPQKIEIGFFQNNKEYYLESSNISCEYGANECQKVYYEKNKKILFDLFGEEQCEEDTDGEYKYINCNYIKEEDTYRGRDFIHSYIDNISSYVSINYNSFICLTSEGNESRCEYMPN